MIASHTASRFKTTCWTLVLNARADREAMADLLGRYWSPIYAYLRRDGRDGDQAEELTQAFLSDVLLGRDLLRSVDPARGRFRSFLLRSLKNYVVDVHRRQHGRDGQREFASLSGLAADGRRFEPVQSDSPDQAFTRQWATTVFNEALRRMQQECANDGMDGHWRVFEARALRPLLYGNRAASVGELAAEPDMASREQVSNVLHSAKRKFFAILVDVIAETVDDPAEIEAELDELMTALGAS